MNKTTKATIAAITAMASVLTVIPASAQGMRDRDRDGRHDQWDRRDDRGGWRGTRDRSAYRWNTYGGRYGYNGYRGSWRTGQRYRNYNDRRYWVSDYGSYGLPAPRRGYRYYRDDSGDIILAAIGTGIIASILATH
jgi:Ni/Co efflux regulator RcnB